MCKSEGGPISNDLASQEKRVLNRLYPPIGRYGPGTLRGGVGTIACVLSQKRIRNHNRSGDRTHCLVNVLPRLKSTSTSSCMTVMAEDTRPPSVTCCSADDLDLAA
jgi:hypothetical protein